MKELCFSTSSKSCQGLASFTQVLVMSLLSIWLRFEQGIYEANFNFNGIDSAFRHPTLCLFLHSVTTQPNVPLPPFSAISANRTGVSSCLLPLQNRHSESQIHYILPVPSGLSILGTSFHRLPLLHSLFTLFICYTCQLYYFKTSSALSQTWTCHQSDFWVFWISSSLNFLQ